MIAFDQNDPFDAGMPTPRHVLGRRRADMQYAFDHVFDEDTHQEHVYDKTTKPIIKYVMDGYNATVFAYGATGSGKTYSMIGTRPNPGVMVRALNDIFEIASDEDEEFK